MTQRIVVKFGTNLLTNGSDRLDAEVMAALVGQVAKLRSDGVELAIVTSGAVAAGRSRLGSQDQPHDIEERQVLAAIGQGHLMERYDALLREQGCIAAQALLTRADLADRAGYLNARNTLDRLLRVGVVPVINENDVVADEELRGGAFGENDSLSALVANLIDADLLVLLSDVGGLYDKDPREHDDAALIPEVQSAEDSFAYAAPQRGSGRGRGGMRAKLEAAALAAGSGTSVVIASGHESDALLRLARGEGLGTRFLAQGSRKESRKRWLLSGLAHSGAIVVDAGAVKALRDQGRSLLPAGITSVRGSFARGDSVELRGPDDERVAVGISNYDAADVERLRGLRSDRIAETLGYDYGEEVIHRNNMALP